MIPQANGVPHLDAAEIKRQATGRWPDILQAVIGIDTELLDGRGHPCPACGGTDRFSAFKDFGKTGVVICRGCHANDNGDGLSVSTSVWREPAGALRHKSVDPGLPGLLSQRLRQKVEA